MLERDELAELQSKEEKREELRDEGRGRGRRGKPRLYGEAERRQWEGICSARSRRTSRVAPFSSRRRLARSLALAPAPAPPSESVLPAAAPAAASSIVCFALGPLRSISPSELGALIPCSPGTPITVAISAIHPCLVSISSKLSSRRACRPCSTELTWPLIFL